MKFAFLIVLSLFSLRCLALNFSGSILKAGGSTRLVDGVGSRSYSLAGATPLMATYINKLEDGDFVSVDGVKNAAQTQLTINSVNFVGLHVLLGTWAGDDNYFYNFRSFHEFNLSKKIGVDTAFRSDYTYLINPTTSAWTILISGTYNSYVAGLTIYSDTEAEIRLYDSETGEVLRTVQLRK